MKPRLFLNALALFIAAAFFTFWVPASAQNTPAGVHTHVDDDGDGYNDNAPDADNDGIPNGQDTDFVRPDGANGSHSGRSFADADGDGFNDNAPDFDNDGLPNGKDPDFVRPGRSTREADGGHSGIMNARGRMNSGKHDTAGNSGRTRGASRLCDCIDGGAGPR